MQRGEGGGGLRVVAKGVSRMGEWVGEGGDSGIEGCVTYGMGWDGRMADG